MRLADDGSGVDTSATAATIPKPSKASSPTIHQDRSRKNCGHPKTAAARAQIDYLTWDSLGARHKRHVF